MKEINTELIDKAFDYCRNMFKSDGKSETEFLTYWQDNYVKYCDDFANGKFLKDKKKPRVKSNKKNKN